LAVYHGSKCRLCRREVAKLYLKGERCLSDKCAFERRRYPPGMHGQSRSKNTDYGLQLREKQKAKRIYGIGERQFRFFFEKAERKRGIAGENLMLLLERRLDNLVYRIGFATSRAEARQLVRHGHFTVNGKKVNIPSYLVREGDVIELCEISRKISKLNDSLDLIVQRGLPSWIELQRDAYRAILKQYPSREDIGGGINEQLIVELYSK